VISWFQFLFFTILNLYRYSVESDHTYSSMDTIRQELIKLNTVDPYLESARFQPLNLSNEKLVSSRLWLSHATCTAAVRQELKEVGRYYRSTGMPVVDVSHMATEEAAEQVGCLLTPLH
jgi:regulator of PEP synthase PpsR (kinase-PPPase family)